jgi:broad specificity phosphatase PhoE
MAVFFMVRHALCDPVGKMIAGRAPDVHLNSEGSAQALRLADRLAELPIDRIFASPLERALETAAPLAHRLRMPCVTSLEFNEIDFGEWTGKSLEVLDEDPVWRQFNAMRSLVRIPGGESMVEVQRRVVNELERLARTHPNDHLVIVTHGDVIKAALTWYSGIPLDFIHRLEVSPASISVLRLGTNGPEISLING